MKEFSECVGHVAARQEGNKTHLNTNVIWEITELLCITSTKEQNRGVIGLIKTLLC